MRKILLISATMFFGLIGNSNAYADVSTGMVCDSILGTTSAFEFSVDKPDASATEVENAIADKIKGTICGYLTVLFDRGEKVQELKDQDGDIYDVTAIKVYEIYSGPRHGVFSPPHMMYTIFKSEQEKS